jgi:hypothetical protein
MQKTTDSEGTTHLHNPKLVTDIAPDPTIIKVQGSGTAPRHHRRNHHLRRNRASRKQHDDMYDDVHGTHCILHVTRTCGASNKTLDLQ